MEGRNREGCDLSICKEDGPLVVLTTDDLRLRTQKLIGQCASGSSDMDVAIPRRVG